MKYNIKLSKGKININGKDYDIPDEVAEFIIYETSTRDDIIQTRDVYKRTIDKAIEWVRDWTHGANDWFEEESKPSELLDILKVVR
jgi:hypothetical protein